MVLTMVREEIDVIADEEQIGKIVQARLAMSWPHTRRKSQRHRVEKSEYLYGREW